MKAIVITMGMVALGIAALAAFQPEAVMAKGGEFGIFEGRIISLAHPTVMASCAAHAPRPATRPVG